MSFEWVYLAGYNNYVEITEFLASEKSHRISPPGGHQANTMRSAVVWRHAPLSWAAGLLLAGGDYVSSRPAIGCRAVIRNLIDTWRICDRDSAVQKRSFGDNWRALPSPYETAQFTCPHRPVFAGDDATDQKVLEVVQVGLGPLRLATCSAWFTCLHARVRHLCPAQHHWRGRPLQRLHLRPQRRQQLGQVSEREQPLGRHWAVWTTP